MEKSVSDVATSPQSRCKVDIWPAHGVVWSYVWRGAPHSRFNWRLPPFYNPTVVAKVKLNYTSRSREAVFDSGLLGDGSLWTTLTLEWCCVLTVSKTETFFLTPLLGNTLNSFLKPFLIPFQTSFWFLFYNLLNEVLLSILYSICDSSNSDEIKVEFGWCTIREKERPNWQ